MSRLRGFGVLGFCPEERGDRARGGEGGKPSEKGEEGRDAKSPFCQRNHSQKKAEEEAEGEEGGAGGPRGLVCFLANPLGEGVDVS